jgi:hypothetical protein
MSISVLQANRKKNINLRFQDLTLDGNLTVAGSYPSGGGVIRQVVNSTVSSVISCVTPVVLNQASYTYGVDSGDAVLGGTITPTAADSVIDVTFSCQFGNSGSQDCVFTLYCTDITPVSLMARVAGGAINNGSLCVMQYSFVPNRAGLATHITICAGGTLFALFVNGLVSGAQCNQAITTLSIVERAP